MRRLAFFLLIAGLLSPQSLSAAPLRVGTFNVDASPPVGSPLAYDPTKGVQSPLSCRGLVLVGAGEPIVLCVVDWIGIGNEGQTVFRQSLAKAAGTSTDRVEVHVVHQHDAPRCDFSAERLLKEHNIKGIGFDGDFARDVIHRAAEAVKMAAANAVPVTHVALGSAIVDRVASARRIIGPDGKWIYSRTSATKDPKVRAYPVGLIDPNLKLISLWNGDKPIVAMTFFATHPQSYYRTGLANPDFPGMARNKREKETGVPHIHFNGAGGNVTAGKWNDGATANRQILADRVAAAMKAAWDTAKKSPISAEDVSWTVVPVALPPAKHLDEATLLEKLDDEKAASLVRWSAATDLSWLRRCRAGEKVNTACLALGNARVLLMPGELFVEYQLAACRMRPDLFVAMAAYGDYAPKYIGTTVAYSEGGYETSERSSNVAPEAEGVVMAAIRKLLEVK